VQILEQVGTPVHDAANHGIGTAFGIAPATLEREAGLPDARPARYQEHTGLVEVSHGWSSSASRNRYAVVSGVEKLCLAEAATKSSIPRTWFVSTFTLRKSSARLGNSQ
jgi:hypothetical protein